MTVCLPVGAADHPATLVRQILARVRDHLVDQALCDPHRAARLADRVARKREPGERGAVLPFVCEQPAITIRPLG